MPIVESNIHALWAAKQVAKGTPATVATKRFIMSGGDLLVNRDDAAENYSDLDRFGNQTDYVQTLTGGGSPVVQAQPDTLAYLFYLFFGGESVGAAVATVLPHTFVPLPSGSFWSTWWKRVGQNTIVRDKFNDCRISSMRVEGSSANKIIKATPTIMSLDPGERFAADPSPGLGLDSPMLYTDGKGTFTIDGVVFSGQSQFAFVIDDALAPYYGDDAVPMEITQGNAQITLEGITVLVDQTGFAQYNKLIYGTAAPAPGAKPIRSLPGLGSYSFTLTRGSGTTLRSIQVTLPGVKWSPDLALPPNPDGGAIELALGGSMRKVAGQPAISVVINNLDVAYTA